MNLDDLFNVFALIVLLTIVLVLYWFYRRPPWEGDKDD